MKINNIHKVIMIGIVVAVIILSGCSKSSQEESQYIDEQSAMPSAGQSKTPHEEPIPSLIQEPTVTPDNQVTKLDAEIAQNPIIYSGATIEDIAKFLNLSEGDLLKQYSEKIEQVRGLEYYNYDLGINIACYYQGFKKDYVVKRVELDVEGGQFFGIDTTMNFKDVMDILGEAEVHVLEDGLPGLMTYELRYQYKDINLRVSSWDINGNGGIYMSIVDEFIPEYRQIRITPDQINHYFDLTLEELRQEIGEDDKKAQSIVTRYSKYGVGFRYDEQEMQLLAMLLDGRYQINDLKNNVSLEEAMNIMGEREVKVLETEEDGPVYYIEYEFENFTLSLEYNKYYGWGAGWEIWSNDYLDQYE